MPTQTCSRNQELTVRILLINIQTQGWSEITDGVLSMRTRTYQLPHQVFFGFSDEVDAAFGAGVIGVGTLLRTTATPVL